MTSYTKMENVCIRGLDKANWMYLKSEAARMNTNMGEMLDNMISFYRTKSKSNWDEILSRKPSLTKAEAYEMKKITEELRNELEFRE
jgi:hypothetical protein